MALLSMGEACDGLTCVVFQTPDFRCFIGWAELLRPHGSIGSLVFFQLLLLFRIQDPNVYPYKFLIEVFYSKSLDLCILVSSPKNRKKRGQILVTHSLVAFREIRCCLSCCFGWWQKRRLDLYIRVKWVKSFHRHHQNHHHHSITHHETSQPPDEITTCIHNTHTCSHIHTRSQTSTTSWIRLNALFTLEFNYNRKRTQVTPNPDFKNAGILRSRNIPIKFVQSKVKEQSSNLKKALIKFSS